MPFSKITLLKEKKSPLPCWNCGKEDGSGDCGYGEYDEWNGDYDCTHPDAEKLECPCVHTFCAECQEKLKG